VTLRSWVVRLLMEGLFGSREAPLLDRTRIEKAPHLCEPFQNSRETGRLLHDLGAMISLLDPAMLSDPILDFGAGSGWISETVARMGHVVTAFDIHGDLAACIEGRTSADSRVDPALISVATGDGHAMPFEDESFGHLLCFDTLHHMRDYDKVFSEFARVLKPGGRAIFVEPGAHHSTSPETIAFMKQKKHDPTWIERDVVIEDIHAISRRSGFSGLTIVPMQHPSNLLTFSFSRWLSFRWRSPLKRYRFGTQLAKTNYYDRVIFFCNKIK
jgi:SAM-dependent methyltransferase